MASATNISLRITKSYSHRSRKVDKRTLVKRKSHRGNEALDSNVINIGGARWPSGLERWLALATRRCGTGSYPSVDNFASELWQFRLPRLASVFQRRH